MSESRRNRRYSTLARAKVCDIHEGDALLRDLSVTGCCLEFTAAVALTAGTRCKIIVSPESAAAIETFYLEAESCWSRMLYDSFEIGFSIIASPKGKSFQRYVDYLSWRSVAEPANSP